MTDDEILARADEIRRARSRKKTLALQRIRSRARFSTPEGRERMRLLMSGYRKKLSPEAKRRIRTCDREWYARPENKEKKRLYEQRPEVKARRRAVYEARKNLRLSERVE